MTTPDLSTIATGTAGKVSHRSALKLAAASAALPLVHIRSGRAAGKLSVAFWDHWVPSGNAVMQKQVAAWGAKNQVEVDANRARQNLRLVEMLEDLDDVQRVTANFDIPEEIYAEVAG